MDRATLTRTSSGYKSPKRVPSSELTVKMPNDEPHPMKPPRKRPTAFLLYLLFMSTLGPLQFGYHLGELNAPEQVIRCEVKKLPTASEYSTSKFSSCIPMKSSQWGMVQALFTVGGLFGALLIGRVATKKGRLFAMRLLTFFLATGPIAEALAGKIWVLGLGRAISGLGAGAATVVCPIYVSEISPPSQRGLFGAFTQVQINLGIALSQLLGYFLSKNSKWRWILATAGFIAAFNFIGLLVAPETPRWLAATNQPRHARTVLQSIRGRDADIRDEMEDWEISGDAEQQSLLTHPRGPQVPRESAKSFIDVIRIRRYRRAVFAVSITMVAQQLTGINSIVMYSVSILGEVMPHKAALVTIIVSAANVVATLIFSPLADKIGRKRCLLASLSGMGCASALLAEGLAKDNKVLTIVGLAIFVCSFSIGLGPVPFILSSELVGPEAVGATSSWALAFNWISTFLVAQFVPLLNNKLPHGKLYLTFSGIAAFFATLITWSVPESKGKASAEEAWAAHDRGCRCCRFCRICCIPCCPCRRRR